MFLSAARSVSVIAPIAVESKSKSRCITNAAATERLSESAKPFRGKYTRFVAAANNVSEAPWSSVPKQIANFFGSRTCVSLPTEDGLESESGSANCDRSVTHISRSSARSAATTSLVVLKLRMVSQLVAYARNKNT